jgi:hypothetical protein
MDVFRLRRKTAKEPESRKAKTVAVRPQLRERLILPHANCLSGAFRPSK